jgi:hypothetical protein
MYELNDNSTIITDTYRIVAMLLLLVQILMDD